MVVDKFDFDVAAQVWNWHGHLHGVRGSILRLSLSWRCLLVLILCLEIGERCYNGVWFGCEAECHDCALSVNFPES